MINLQAKKVELTQQTSIHKVPMSVTVTGAVILTKHLKGNCLLKGKAMASRQIKKCLSKSVFECILMIRTQKNIELHNQRKTTREAHRKRNTKTPAADRKEHNTDKL